MIDLLHGIVNPKDPLKETISGETLFRRLTDQCDGFPIDMIVDAAINLLVNAIRQGYQQKSKAINRIDQLVAVTRKLVDEQYNSVGRLRGVYPYDQNISAKLVNLKDQNKWSNG